MTMSIIVENTSDYLADQWPAVNNWYPCKEQRAGIVLSKGELVDYAKGEYQLAALGALNIATADAIAAGTANLEIMTYQGAAGSMLSVGANQGFIALAVAEDTNDGDANLTIGAEGSTKNNKSICFCENGIAKIKHDVLGDIDDTGPPLVGQIVRIIGLDRTNDRAIFGGVNSGGTWVTPTEIDASAYAGEALNFGGTSGTDAGMFLKQVGSGTVTYMFNMVVAVFTGAFPDYSAGSSSTLAAQLVQWRTDSLAGTKNLPTFLKDLVR